MPGLLVYDFDQYGLPRTMSVQEGVVKCSFFQKGYGFIWSLGGGEDIFFHRRQGCGTSLYQGPNGKWLPRFSIEPNGGIIWLPKRNERVVFLDQIDERGTYASVWAPLSDYMKTLALCRMFEMADIGCH